MRRPCFDLREHCSQTRFCLCRPLPRFLITQLLKKMCNTNIKSTEIFDEKQNIHHRERMNKEDHQKQNKGSIRRSTLCESPEI